MLPQHEIPCHAPLTDLIAMPSDAAFSRASSEAMGVVSTDVTLTIETPGKGSRR